MRWGGWFEFCFILRMLLKFCFVRVVLFRIFIVMLRLVMLLVVFCVSCVGFCYLVGMFMRFLMRVMVFLMV